METTNLLTLEQIRHTNAAPLVSHVRTLCQKHPGPSYVLLVGASLAAAPAAAEQTLAPAPLGLTGRMKGQPSDHDYGSPASNSAPTVAVGRFPARNVEEVRLMVEKTLKLERDERPGAWRNRLVLLMGNPGGGAFAESVVEGVAQTRLNQLHPAWELRALFHSDLSRFYLPSTRLRDQATRDLEEGEIFSLYLGHSNPGGLWSNNTNFLSREDWARLKIARGAGVFFTCGCYACQPGGEGGEGYGVAAMRNPTGPAAVIGATGESYSAPGQLALDGLLRVCSQPPFPQRLAAYWLAVQAGLASGEIDQETFQVYDLFDGSGGKVPLSVQRVEHLEMWTLLGDPALRLPLLPLDLRLEVAGPVSASQSLAVKGVASDQLAGATVRVTLERTVGSAPVNLEKLPVSAPQTRAARESLAVANHQRANNYVLASAETRLTGNRFECQVPVPITLPWSNLVVRAHAATATADFYLTTSCADGIPMWDTGAPNLHRLPSDYLNKPADPFNRWEPVDSSAAAIAAQGLIRFGNFLSAHGDLTGGARYRQAGLTIANTLFSEPYLSANPKHQGLLLHSVYHRPNGWDYIAPGQQVPNGESSMWGDYHLRELALLLWREARGESYLTFFDYTKS